MKFVRLLLRQLVVLLPTLFVLVTLSFFLMHAAPGGPFDGERPLDPIVRQHLLARYNLDQPVWMQYLLYLKDFVQFNLGPSMTMRDYTVNELVGQNLPYSLNLGFWAMLYSTLTGVSLGALAARKQNSTIDYSVMSLAMVGVVVPSFVLSPILIWLLSIKLHVFPAGSYTAGPLAYILPAFALGLNNLAITARIMRGSMIETLNSNYIRMAYAKGLSTRLVIFRHALKGAILPVVSYLGPAVAAVLTGSIVIESIFSLPGIGRYYVQAALARDYPLVMGVTVIYAAFLLFMNMLVDLLYSFLDPKIK